MLKSVSGVREQLDNNILSNPDAEDAKVLKFISGLQSDFKKNKEKAARGAAGHEIDSTPPVTLSSLLYASLLGMIAPILLYWLLSYFITRRWLDLRAHETVEMYLSQQENPQVDDETND